MKREAAWTEIKAGYSVEQDTCVQASRAHLLFQEPPELAAVLKPGRTPVHQLQLHVTGIREKLCTLHVFIQT